LAAAKSGGASDGKPTRNSNGIRENGNPARVNYPRAYKIFARPQNLGARTRLTPINPAGPVSVHSSAVDNPPAAGHQRFRPFSPRRRHEKCIAEQVHAKVARPLVGPVISGNMRSAANRTQTVD